MHSLAEITTNNPYQLVSTDINKSLPIDKTTGTSTGSKKYDNDHLFEMLPDLVDNEWRAWYCGAFFKLGKERVLRCAAVARQEGKNPRRLFSFLIRQEMAKC